MNVHYVFKESPVAWNYASADWDDWKSEKRSAAAMKAATLRWPFWKRLLCLTQSSILIGFESWGLDTWRQLCGFWDGARTLCRAGDLRWKVSALPFIMLLPLRLYHNKAPYALRHVLEERRGDNKVSNSDDSELNGVQRLWTVCRRRTKNLSAFLLLLIC